MTRALKSVDGVSEVEVLYSDKKAKVLGAATLCDASQHPALLSALERAGYKGRVAETHPHRPTEPESPPPAAPAPAPTTPSQE